MFIFNVENIIKLKERALNKFNKAKKGIKDVRPKSKLTTARDDRVEHAMRGLNKGIFDELKFLSEVAEPEDGEEVFEIYGKFNYLLNNFLVSFQYPHLRMFDGSCWLQKPLKIFNIIHARVA